MLVHDLHEVRLVTLYNAIEFHSIALVYLQILCDTFVNIVIPRFFEVFCTELSISIYNYVTRALGWPAGM